MIGRETTCRNHAVDMRMMQKILPPGVQHTKKADVCTKVFRIGGDLQQCGGAGAKQKTVDDFLVVERQCG